MIEQLELYHDLAVKLYNELDNLLIELYNEDDIDNAESIADFLSDVDILQDYLFEMLG